MRQTKPSPAFKHRLFPSCDGQPVLRPLGRDPLSRVKLRFLDAYFHINLAYAKLVACRKTSRSKPGPPRQHRILHEIEKAILARESLEDRYAARGIIAAPIYKDGFTVDLRFQHPGSATPQPVRIVSSASSFIAFPIPRKSRARR